MNNYFNLPEEFTHYENSTVVILPVPFDKTCSWLKGANKAPEAIHEASHQVELYDIETNSEIYQKGIYSEQPILAKTSEEMVEKTYQKTTQLLQDKKFVVTLGGDHSVSIGAIKAHANHFKNVSILHLDAHADMRDSYEGNIYSHASVMARAKEVTNNIVSVGIRSMDISERDQLEKNKLFLAKTICSGKDNWIDEVVKQLSENVYITIDVDVFDIGIMPSTGTPEPGGLNWYHVINLINTVCKKKNVVGFDTVELAPSETNKAPDFLVAKLIYQILSANFN